MIVITGGAGFIGSMLLDHFNQNGLSDILVVDQDAKNSPKWDNLKGLRFQNYMESEDFLVHLETGGFDGKVEAVFHMGACSSTTEMDVNFLRRNNTEYSERIAQWCVNHAVYLCYASSAATYGAGEHGFSDDDELTPKLHPLNPYGRSKLNFDIWVLENGLQNEIVGFRFFNVYGPNEAHKGDMRSLAHKGYEQVQSTGKLKLFKSYKKEYRDGGQKRDFVYVKDVVAVMDWFSQNQQWKGIYNLGSGHAESWNDLAHSLFRACGKPANIEYIAMPDSIKNQYQYFTEANMTKLRATRCPVEFRNLEKGVGDYVKNHLSRRA